MLPLSTVPPGLLRLLNVFWPCFTAPTFEVFAALVTGMIAQTGRRSVCGMLTGAGLARRWPHDRAHAFFSRRVWSVHDVGMTLARLITEIFCEEDAALTVAVDDTLVKRHGPTVFGRSFQHDGARPSRSPLSFGVCYVVAAIVVTVKGRAHPMALPALAACWIAPPKRRTRTPHPPPRPSATATTARALTAAQKRLDRAQHKLDLRHAKEAALAPGHRLPGTRPDLTGPLEQARRDRDHAHRAHQQARDQIQRHLTRSAPKPASHDSRPTKTEIAIALASRLAAAFPHRMIHVVADAAYHNPALRFLPDNLTWTFRLPKNAVLHAPPTPRAPHTRGRPPVAGLRLGTLEEIAATADFSPHTVHRNARSVQVDAAVIDCRWKRPLGALALRLILVRDRGHDHGYGIALLSTDTTTSADQIITRYAHRWSIEVCFQQSRAHLGLGHPHNRTRAAVERTVPTQFMAYSIVVCWYALHGHPPREVRVRREHTPGYPTKTDPAFADMIALLRRAIIKHRVLRTAPDQRTADEIEEIIFDHINTAA